MADIKFLVTVDTASGKAQLAEFSGAIDGVGKSADATKGKHDELSKNVKASEGIFAGAKAEFLNKVAAYATGQAVYDQLVKAGRAVIGMVKDSVAESMKAEQVEAALVAAIKTTGSETSLSVEKFKQRASALERMTVYDDEAIMSVQTLLVQMTRLNQDGIDRATKASMGLASVMQIDLQSAGMMVMKAMEGNVGALSRYGIKVNDSLSPMQKQADILSQLEKMFGRATAETDTYAGKMKQLDNAVGNMKETFGGIIVSSKFVKEAFDGIRATVEFLNREIMKYGNMIDTLARYIPILKNYQQQWRIMQVLNAEAVNDQERLNGAVKGSYIVYQGLIKVFEKLGVHIPQFVKDLVSTEKPLRGDGVKEFQAKIEELKKSLGVTFTTDTKKKIDDIQFALKHMALTEDSIKKLKAELAGLLQTVANSQGFLTVFRGQWGDVKDSLDHVIKKKTEVADWVQMKLPKAYNAGLERIKRVLAEFSGANAAAAQAIREKWASETAKIGEAFKSAFSQMGEIAQQGYTNQVVRIENEYAKRKQYVIASVKDEVEKNARLQVLDQNMELEKRAAMRRYAGFQKAAAIASATINMAEAITKTIAQTGVLGIVMGAITAALCAVQIGVIASQPLPLAKGAIFTRRTLLTADTGSQYEVAEAGEPEILASPRMLRQAIAGGRGGARGAGANKISITVPIYIAGQKISEQIINLIQEADALGKLRLRRAVA